MAAGRKTGGRQKGTPNKTTATTKAAIELAAERLGGGERLYQWAKSDPDNEKAFWVSIYPKLLPLQLANDPDNPLISNPSELSDNDLAAIAAAGRDGTSAPPPRSRKLN